MADCEDFDAALREERPPTPTIAFDLPSPSSKTWQKSKWSRAIKGIAYRSFLCKINTSPAMNHGQKSRARDPMVALIAVIKKDKYPHQTMDRHFKVIRVFRQTASSKHSGLLSLVGAAKP